VLFQLVLDGVAVRISGRAWPDRNQAQDQQAGLRECMMKFLGSPTCAQVGVATSIDTNPKRQRGFRGAVASLTLRVSMGRGPPMGKPLQSGLFNPAGSDKQPGHRVGLDQLAGWLRWL